MNKKRFIVPLLLWSLVLLLVACGGNNDSGNTESNDGSTTETTAADNTDNTAATSSNNKLDSWLQEIKNGDVAPVDMGEDINYGLGYVSYYGSIESTVLDTLIYNGLLVRNKLATGEATEDSLSQNEQNLLDLTDGVEFNPDVDPLDQTAQTPEIREKILAHIVQNQANLPPEEALASGNVVGIIAPPAPEAVGEKFLVYGQESPDADFAFIGVVIATDATSSSPREPYNVAGWDNLTWLGDAAGPYWQSLPVGSSGDPANTNEGRPGILLISEEMFNSLNAGKASN